MKLCWACKHCTFNPGSQGYSEMTPGSDTVLKCAKGVWDAMDHGVYGGQGLAEMLVNAKTCKKFKEADWLKEKKAKRSP